MFFARSPPFRRKTGALALRQQIFFTNQQVAERCQQMQSIDDLVSQGQGG